MTEEFIIERNADPTDTASNYELIHNADLVAEASRRVRQTQTPTDIDGKLVYEITDCVECGEGIGEGRLKAAIKNTLCITCAEMSEIKGRNYR